MMKRRSGLLPAVVALLVAVVATPLPSSALDEPDRLWLVGEHAFADKLYPVARHALEQLVAQYPSHPHLADAVLMLGQARLELGDPASALEAFRKAESFTPPPGRPMEPRFWEAEALFRLKKFADARAAYDSVLRADAAGPLAPDALYGKGWSELELKHPEAATKAFNDFLATWPKHALAPSATLQLARALVDAKRPRDAQPLLADFQTKYPESKLVPDAQYLLGWVKATSGDPKGGVADLRAFVAAYPSHPQAPVARRLITQTLARYGDREELQQSYKTLMEQDPPTAEGLYDAASIAGRLGRPRDREAAWKRLRAQFPEHALTRRLALDLGGDAFKRKAWKDASALGQIAAQSDEDAVKSEGWLLVGESELKLKRFTTAAKAFEGVGAVDNVDTSVRYRALAGLGLAREELREWRAALAAYESVVNKSPDATLRNWAKQRVAAVKTQLGRSPAPAPGKSGAKKNGGRS